jgi:hypothetical protein
VRFEAQLHPLTLEHREQPLHRPPELRFAGGGGLRPAAELRVHHLAAEVDGDLDGALPVADRRMALVLVRA